VLVETTKKLVESISIRPCCCSYCTELFRITLSNVHWCYCNEC